MGESQEGVDQAVSDQGVVNQDGVDEAGGNHEGAVWGQFRYQSKTLYQCIQISVKILVWKHMLFMNLQKVQN